MSVAQLSGSENKQSQARSSVVGPIMASSQSSSAATRGPSNKRLVHWKSPCTHPTGPSPASVFRSCSPSGASERVIERWPLEQAVDPGQFCFGAYDWPPRLNHLSPVEFMKGNHHAQHGLDASVAVG